MLKHNVVDRIVDGGYIENYGAITAMELAVAINAVQPGLAPFVLIISNDPDENPIINKIDVPDAAFLTDVSIPLQAIASARDGRGRLAVQQLNSVLGVLTKSECGDDSAHIRVWPQYSNQDASDKKKKRSLPISLSWWLSTPIQLHLHQQTESTKLRQRTIELRTKTKSKRPGAPSKARRPAWRPDAEGLLRRRSLQDRRQAIDLAFD